MCRSCFLNFVSLFEVFFFLVTLGCGVVSYDVEMIPIKDISNFCIPFKEFCLWNPNSNAKNTNFFLQLFFLMGIDFLYEEKKNPKI